ncbi:unnamed protein product [Albugo candida]|uniref:Uncharacterized protein n=1 Tax=Albugo candida TaxID=65357 RepID=A0A024GL82_9STRA|nr:unnamed protein product [Albugo candida]|eukprot:CCI47648.1 unnamed protein product [Albugo candida]
MVFPLRHHHRVHLHSQHQYPTTHPLALLQFLLVALRLFEFVSFQDMQWWHGSLQLTARAFFVSELHQMQSLSTISQAFVNLLAMLYYFHSYYLPPSSLLLSCVFCHSGDFYRRHRTQSLYRKKSNTADLLYSSMICGFFCPASILSDHLYVDDTPLKTAYPSILSLKNRESMRDRSDSPHVFEYAGRYLLFFACFRISLTQTQLSEL